MCLGGPAPLSVKALDAVCLNPCALLCRVPGSPGCSFAWAPALPWSPFRGAVLFPTRVLCR